MVKKIISVVTAFLMLCCMIPFYAFAETATCPKCGQDTLTTNQDISVEIGEKVGLPLSLKRAYCSNCHYAKYEYNVFGISGEQSYDDGDELHIINFLNSLKEQLYGKNATTTKFTPGGGSTSGGGAGRRPAGYTDDNGTPSVNPDGTYSGDFAMIYDGYWTPFASSTTQLVINYISTYENGSFSTSGDGNISAYAFYDTTNATKNLGVRTAYYFKAPVTGFYDITVPSVTISASAKTYNGTLLTSLAINGKCSLSVSSGLNGMYSDASSVNSSGWFQSISNYNSGQYLLPYVTDTYTHSFYVTKGDYIECLYYSNIARQLSSSANVWYSISMNTAAPTIVCRSYADSSDNKLTNQTNITINNDYSQTWNGNIYTDNSTNLTYIYPQYTTINEKNETVTNISTNPIIYNNETKQYYTYDTVTNNYYYITYETTPTPTPSPSPAPVPTWTPGGGATRGGGVGRHPSDTDAADWTLHYYILNNRRYDAYYALKKTEVDTDTKLPWVDNKKYISTTQIPIANGQYTVSVPDGVYWRVWSWDEASQTLTGVNSSNWHSTINNFLFNATGEYIFEFCKADGSDFDTAKDVTLKLKNDKITDYEDGGTIVEEPTPSPSPEPTETPSPTEPPIPTATPTPGGGTVPTPGGGTSGGNSGNGFNISGGDDEGLFGWLWDLLKDIVKAILKAIFKVLSGILGFLIWLVERVGLLFPFLPAPAVAALGAGVVLVFVIKIIRFIRG